MLADLCIIYTDICRRGRRLGLHKSTLFYMDLLALQRLYCCACTGAVDTAYFVKHKNHGYEYAILSEAVVQYLHVHSLLTSVRAPSKGKYSPLLLSPLTVSINASLPHCTYCHYNLLPTLYILLVSPPPPPHTHTH